MSDIVARLRAEIAWEQEIGELLEEAATEIERLRLTDAEREAIQWFAHYGLPERYAAALRGLLERIGTR